MSKFILKRLWYIFQRLRHIVPGLLERCLHFLFLLAYRSSVGEDPHVGPHEIPYSVTNIIQAVPLFILFRAGDRLRHLLRVRIDLREPLHRLFNAYGVIYELGGDLLGGLLDLKECLPHDHFALCCPCVVVQPLQKAGDPRLYLLPVLEHLGLCGRVRAPPAVNCRNVEPLPGGRLGELLPKFFRYVCLEPVAPARILHHLAEHVFHRLLGHGDRVALVPELSARLRLQHRVGLNGAVQRFYVAGDPRGLYLCVGFLCDGIGRQRQLKGSRGETEVLQVGLAGRFPAGDLCHDGQDRFLACAVHVA